MHEELGQGNLKTNLWGFLLSLLLTLLAYFAVEKKLLEGKALVFALGGLALLQAFVQLKLFLHLGQESHPRWKYLTFFFMALVLLILVLGSIWIMYHLNYRQMPMSPGLG